MTVDWIEFVFLILLFVRAESVEQNLGGTWVLTNYQDGHNLNAIVPGGIYTDLMRNNIIDDVFYGFNDVKSRWVSKSNWNYTKKFSVDYKLASCVIIKLIFEGVDTFSNVYFNDIRIGTTSNMFVRYEFNVKPYIKLGSNTLRVQFESSVIKAKSLFKNQLEKYLVPPICVPSQYNGECHVNHIRKMQASFGWDWGPAIPSMGIWKEVYLQGYNITVLSDITINLKLDETKNHWNVLSKVFFKTGNNNKVLQGELRIELQTEIVKITEIYKINVQKDENDEFTFSFNVTVPNQYVNLWWPNGYGKATLYEMKVSFVSPNKSEQTKRTLKIGFRSIKLIQNDIEKGTTFYLKVNNVPIFAKGSNIVPLSILPEQGYNLTHIKFLLKSTKDANMNMLRVWGGGVYESDEFYETADEMGILIWQDFMFACSMYPVSEYFIKNVSLEVKQQVRRLQYHPSIAIWSANNENEAALRENWYGTKSNFSLYKSDFKILYVDIIKNQALSIDDSRPFLISSPTNGFQSEIEDYVAQDPQSHFYGDVHFYNYLIDGWNENIYPVARFVSEYGYQSLPSSTTLLSATNCTTDLNIYDEFLRHRQHHEFGYLQIDLLITYQLSLPSESSPTFYKAFIFYSQIVQAMSVKIETEFYRRWRSNTNDLGEGLTMGALYWQLNDVWAAPSWSSIDFKGNWKMLHYHAKKFFAPVIITAMVTVAKEMSVFVVSDLRTPIRNVIVDVNVYKWDSVTPVEIKSVRIDVDPGLSQKVKTFSLRKLFSEINGNPCQTEVLENCFVYFTLTDNDNSKIAPDNYLFPIALKRAKLFQPNLEIVSVSQMDNEGKEFNIKIRTDVVALFVWIEVLNVHGVFSENGYLQVTSEKNIQFYATEPLKLETIISNISVTNLMNKEYY